ncbi:addiction module protein [Methylococcus mesophilus]|uniref:addiction module protein n=1 Tax=Methylococcus mesophilus TaxID=2993564 RepID=UPI00224AF26A|nr:addiction module protein [Methylococcus mesophilus]UZR30826.1 addiction module protein [Methylococcus mesophilus]
MPETSSTQIPESLKGLSIQERIQIVEDLWDSIAIPQENFGLPEARRGVGEANRRAGEERKPAAFLG